MFQLIEVGSIFDLIMIVFSGITVIVTVALVYCVIIQALGYNPLEKGVIRRIIREKIFKK